MWDQLLANIRHTVARAIYHVGLATQAPTPPPVAAAAAAGAGAGRPAQQLRENRPDQAAIPAARANGRKIGRNDPCWCGSGKKFKRCHGVAA
jgi:preprotein translocase subunit SecA